jgi:hypothetical protein
MLCRPGGASHLPGERAMKVLFVWDSAEYLRFFDSVVEECLARGHEVAIAYNKTNIKKLGGLRGLRAIEGRVRVLGIVPRNKRMWRRIAYGLRGTMDFVRYFHPRFTVATAARARMRRKALPAGYRWLDRIPRLPPAAVRVLERLLATVETAIPVHQPIVAFLQREGPDVMLVSPLVDCGSDQVDTIKAARACGVRTAVCVASWDNLTNKGVFRIEPDLVVVWNDAQKREAQDYHYVPAHKITTTGAQLFDKWFVTQATRDRTAFCARVGLPDTRPFLLFTGSSGFISESRAEVAFVLRWIESLRSSGDPMLRSINVLVRPHPYNCHSWDPDPLAGIPGAVFFPRTNYDPMDEVNRADFFDSIYHSTAVVGINTSAMIEAAIIGRPVFSLLAEEFAGTQQGLVHFHYLALENGGCVRVASVIDDHVRQLSECLGDLAEARAETERFIAHFVRPHGLDRPATPIFVDSVERLAAAAAPAPQATPVTTYLLRPVVLGGALIGMIGAWVQRPHPVRWLLRRSRKMTRRTTKRVGRTARLTAHRGAKQAKQWREIVLRPLRARR